MAILGWLVAGAVRFYRNGFPALPGAVRAATTEYHNTVDPVGRFISERIRPKDGATVKVDDVYSAYEAFTLHEAITTVRRQDFGTAFQRRYPKPARETTGLSKHSYEALYFGVELTPADESPNESTFD